MVEEVKTAILNRIKRAIDDDSKSISPESLKTLTDIILCLGKKEAPVEKEIMAMVKKDDGGGI